MRTNKPLRPLTRIDLDGFYAEIDTLYGAYDCACDKNQAYLDIDWDDFNDPGYQRLTESQRTLNNLVVLDGQVNNGGLVQLFTNFAYAMDHIAIAVQDFGWSDLSSRFDAKFIEAFQQPKNAGYFEQVNADFQTAFRDEPWEKAAEKFHAAYREFDFNDFDSWWYDKETQTQAARNAIAFMRRRETDLFAIA